MPATTFSQEVLRALALGSFPPTAAEKRKSQALLRVALRCRRRKGLSGAQMELIGNANPEGCNQYTGKDCDGYSHLELPELLVARDQMERDIDQEKSALDPDDPHRILRSSIAFSNLRTFRHELIKIELTIAKKTGDKTAIKYHEKRLKTSTKNLTTNASPVVVSRLAPYLHDLLGDVTKKQSRVIAQAIKRGIERKWQDSTVARTIAKFADLEPDRAKVIARTEMARAKADIQLGKKRDSAKVVFTLGNEDACPICEALDGKVFTVRKAQGVIPVHPNCYCYWSDAAKGARVTRNVITNCGGEGSGRPGPCPEPDLDIKTVSGIRKFAVALRKSAEKVSGGNLKDWCVTVSNAARKMVGGTSQVWSGYFEGREDQAHSVVKVGGYWLDVTADQFGAKGVIIRKNLDERFKDFTPENTAISPHRTKVEQQIIDGTTKRLRGAKVVGNSFRDSLLRFSALNAFCATGEGGGVDPSCSPGKKGYANKSDLSGIKDAEVLARVESTLGDLSATYGLKLSGVKTVAMEKDDVFDEASAAVMTSLQTSKGGFRSGSPIETSNYLDLDSEVWADKASLKAYRERLPDGYLADPSAAGILRHEFAHALEKLHPEHAATIQSVYADYRKKGATVSEYSMSSSREMVAEAFSHYHRQGSLEGTGLERLTAVFESWKV